jgi:hypothetical protein
LVVLAVIPKVVSTIVTYYRFYNIAKVYRQN